MSNIDEVTWQQFGGKRTGQLTAAELASLKQQLGVITPVNITSILTDLFEARRRIGR